MSYVPPRPRGCDNAKVIEVIETVAGVGLGVAGDPYRPVYEYWSKDGELLAERDTWNGDSSERARMHGRITPAIEKAIHEFFMATASDAMSNDGAIHTAKSVDEARAALDAAITIAINEAESKALASQQERLDKLQREYDDIARLSHEWRNKAERYKAQLDKIIPPESVNVS